MSSPKRIDEFPGAELRIGAGLVEQVAESAAALAAQHIALWSYIDRARVRTIQVALKSDIVATTRITHTIAADKSRTVMMLKGLKGQVAPEDEKLISALWNGNPIESVRVQRNKYAHHVWCSSKEIPGALILIDSEDLLDREARWFEGDQADYSKAIMSRAFVYSPDDIREDIKLAHLAHDAAIALVKIVRGEPSASIGHAWLQRELAHLPSVQARYRQAAPSSPAQSPGAAPPLQP